MAGFKLGELIMISKPYAYVLDKDWRGKRCDCCFKRQNSLKRCSRCSCAYYCHKECQAKGWKEGHKMECKFLKSKPNTTTLVRLLSLIILKRRYGKDEPSEEIFGRKVTFETLMSHAEDIKQDLRYFNEANLSMEFVTEFIGEENMPPPEVFIDIFGKKSVNSIRVLEALTPLGTALYLGASLIDHSCEPNAEYCNEGTAIFIRAKKDIPIKELDQIRISYMNVLQLTKDRQDHLMSQYFFLCQCSRCTTSAFDKEMTTMSDDGEEYLEKLNETLNTLEDFEKIESTAAGFEGISELLSLPSVYENCIKQLEELEQQQTLPDLHISRIRMLEWLLTNCKRTGDRMKALEYELKLLKPYRLYLGPCSLVLGFHLFGISILQKESENFPEAMKNANEAKHILKLTIGEKHPLYQQFFVPSLPETGGNRGEQVVQDAVKMCYMLHSQK